MSIFAQTIRPGSMNMGRKLISVTRLTHDLIHVATVHTARLSLSLLDEVAEERGAWPKRQMIHVAVQGRLETHTGTVSRFSCPAAERQGAPGPRVANQPCDLRRVRRRGIGCIHSLGSVVKYIG